MILITTAMMAEARPIIKALGLKCVDKGFGAYQGENCVLIVTGIGVANSAAQTGWAFGRYNISGAVNIGIAGSKAYKKGEVVLANAILQESTGHIFLPDTLYEAPFKCARITTCDSPKTNGDNDSVYDMESYGFARAAYPHLTTDKIAVLKLISDGADEDTKSVTAPDVSGLIEARIGEIKQFIDSFAEYCKETDFLPDVSHHEQAIAEAFRLTCTQREMLKKELINCAVYYGTLPNVEKLPPQQEKTKKGNAAAFEAFVEKMRANEDCIPVEFNRPTPPKRRFFDRIYIEDDVWTHPSSEKIKDKLTNASIIKIPHYKSVFNVGRQNVIAQKCRKNLILAKATGQLVYKGSDYCNAFGFDKFYYCSTVMGCVYGCEYCYLTGIYNSANVVAFVNTEDFFEQIEKECGNEKSLVCCSYDSDIIALDGVLGTVGAWLDFAKKHPNITLEIRTKSANVTPFDCDPIPNVIIAYTVSPESVCREYEASSPPLKARLFAATKMSQAGWRVRICMEPILYPVVEIDEYFKFADEIASNAKNLEFEDIVVGEFRMNRQCFAKIAEIQAYSKLFHNPFYYSDGTFVSYKNASSAVKMIAERIRLGCNTRVVEFEYNNEE